MPKTCCATGSLPNGVYEEVEMFVRCIRRKVLFDSTTAPASHTPRASVVELAGHSCETVLRPKPWQSVAACSGCLNSRTPENRNPHFATHTYSPFMSDSTPSPHTSCLAFSIS